MSDTEKHSSDVPDTLESLELLPESLIVEISWRVVVVGDGVLET